LLSFQIKGKLSAPLRIRAATGTQQFAPHGKLSAPLLISGEQSVMFTQIMTKKRIIVFIFLSFIFGVALGGVGVYLYFGKSISDSMAILSMKNRTELELRVFNAYKNESPQVGIWALTNLSEILHEEAKIYQKDRDLILKDLLLVYARLALLFRTQNDEKKYQVNIAKAVDLSREIYPNEFQSEKELITFVKKFDSIKDEIAD
jgi:hypothetical protein